MKMPSVKFYYGRARIFGLMIVLSLLGYLVAHLLLTI
jgi:hypothetical protein